MKDSKFRAWDKENKWFIYTDYFHGKNGSRGLFWDNVAEFGLEVTEYTGKKDKDDIEIYEGDGVKKVYPKMNRECIGVVRWESYSDDEYVSNIECWMVDGSPLSDLGGLWGEASHIYKVVGNIYMNKELLK